jgi:AcrR family transcriptional regulator
MAAFPSRRDSDQMVCYLLTGRQGTKGVVSVDERMDRRIARLALARFRVSGFVGTSIADLAGALGVSKAAIYYH